MSARVPQLLRALQSWAQGGGRGVFQEEDGFTLVETVVATVMIVVALLPLATAVVFATARPEARLQAEAAAMAQSELEDMLAQDPAVWREAELVEDLWRVTREVARDGELATVTVHVLRGQAADTLAVLQASRLDRPSVDVPEWAEPEDDR
ncbi:MAG: hypothetical protein AAGI52_06025 [Bacteroidota bacterium]